MIELIINETEKFPLTKGVENTRLILIKNRPNISRRPVMDSYEINDLDWENVRHAIFKEFNADTDILLGVQHTEEGTKIRILDHTQIKRKITKREESAEKRKKGAKDEKDR